MDKKKSRSIDEFGEIMTKEEVGEFLRLSRNTVTRLIQKGVLKGTKFGEQYRFRKQDILALFEGGNENDFNAD